MSVRRGMLTVALGAILVVGGARRALAETETSDAFAGAEPVAAADLETERAGFVTAAGITFDFGATVKTTVDGQLALVSTLQLNSMSQVTQTTWVNPALTNATVIQPGDGQSLSALTGLSVDGVQNANGVVLKNGNGVTAVLADVSPTSIQSLVLNTANGQTISETTTVNLTLPNFAAMQTQFVQSGLVSGLNSSIRSTQLLGH
jgi:hypothetical protein